MSLDSPPAVTGGLNCRLPCSGVVDLHLACDWWPRIFTSHGGSDRIEPRHPRRRQPAVRRRLVQARAARTDDPVGPERRRQVDSASDPRGRADSGLGRALAREGRPGGAPRPAPAARPRDDPRRLRLLRPRRDDRTRGAPRRPRAGDVRRRPLGGDDGRLRRRPGSPRPRRRLPLARPGARRARRPRVPRRARRAAAGHILGRRADPGVAGACARHPTRAAAPRRADQPPRHPALEWLEGYLTDLDAAVVLVAHDRWFLEAVGTSVLELEAGAVALLLRARGTPGGPSRRRARSRSARRSSASRPRSRGWSGSSSASATRRRRRGRRSRGSSRSSGSRPMRSRTTRGRARRCASRSRRRRGPGGSCSKIENARIEVPGRTLLESRRSGSSAASTSSLVGPNGAGKTTLIETMAGRREPAAGKLAVGHNVAIGYLSQHADTAAGEGTVLEALQRGTGLSRPEGTRPARRLPVLGPRRRQAARRHLRRRAAAALAGDPGRLGRQRADPRRADQPPRHREPRGPRGRAPRVRGSSDPRLPRPRPARGGRDADGGLRGR